MSEEQRPTSKIYGTQAGRTQYGASGGRKIAFSFLLLFLLPFFASLPVMLFQRLAVGQWHDLLPLAIVGVFFSVLMLLLLIQLIFSLRARVTLGSDAVTFTLPSGPGPTPKLRYASGAISYSEIKTVAVRRELFGGSWAPVVLQGTHILKADGHTVTLGYVSEAKVDPALPYPAIAHQIAERAGLAVSNEGGLWRTLYKGRQTRALGVLPGQRLAIAAADVDDLNRRHRRMIMLLTNFLVTLLVIGIAMDIVAR